jgi:molybdopterin-dependent oxidoreductase alpha subunit
MSRKSSGCRNVEGVRPYTAPAGGWGALHAVARTIRNQMDFAEGSKLLLKNNQPSGFDCPGCAWPDPKHTSAFEFCENGAKAVTWEATKKRVTPEFLSAHTVSELWTWNDHDIEDAGRLTEPVRYDAASDTFVRLSWDDAFARIGAGLRALPDPNMAEFYTSGRASNEAAFLYQLFVREYGTNNFPDCSNMCHEATSVGLPRSIGMGKGSVSLEDFDHADMILSLGHNPGTNHPRMMSTLREAARRNVPIVVFNPMKERALERFASPQHPIEMATFSDTKIASSYHQVRIGGDVAALKGIMKALLALDRAACGTVFDQTFIDAHTTGIEPLLADLDATDWDDIVAISGLDRETLEHVAALYARSNAVIACYGMGLTQNMHGTETVRQLANLLLLRGNIGKPGAGICPLRGHSNVQGDRTVGISEEPAAALLDAIERHFGFAPPREHGHNAVKAIAAIAAGESKALICLGGNLAVAMPDQELTFPAMRKLDLSVHIATKLNRSHLLVGKETILLPCLGRTELDTQASGPQSITVEDSMSMVHISRGKLPPASDQLRSEPAIVAGIAKATLPGTRVDWDNMVVDYDHIRDAIEAVVAGFTDYNKRIREPGGFRLPLPATERRWDTPSGRAQFATFAGLGENAGKLMLTTIRSHDQYNTTIYSLDDRYRGVFGRRDVVFLNAADLAANGLAQGDLIDVLALDGGDTHVLRGFTAIAYDLPRGSAAAYYPEANVLVPLSRHDKDSGTPSYKAIPIHVARHQETSKRPDAPAVGEDVA